MRFIAILAVVTYHMADMLPRKAAGEEWILELIGFGNIGVQFFFAISGFILAVPMLHDRLFGGERVSLGRYYLRRLTRIEPPYVFCLMLLVLLGLTTHPGPDQGWHLLASLFYVHGLVYNSFSTINFVAWSLEVEIQFYLLMPLIAWVFFRGDRPWVRRLLLGAFCVPFMVRQSIVHDHFPHGLFLIDQIQFFVAGIIVADIYVCGFRTRCGGSKARQWRFDILATAGFVLVPWSIDLSWQAARYVVPLGIGLWMYGALRGLLWHGLLGNRWIAVLGGMCYTVYLYHWLVLRAGLRLLGGFPFDSTWANLLLIAPFLLALVFLVSAVLYLAFEKPFMGGFRDRPHRAGFAGGPGHSPP
jgi:peptidoglycan/LPS O-acetylase OafA/YrhL